MADGSRYTKLNNVADPVPGVIAGAQKAFSNDSLTDNDLTPTEHINEPQFNPINAHSLDKIYTKHMAQAAGARDCDCS